MKEKNYATCFARVLTAQKQAAAREISLRSAVGERLTSDLDRKKVKNVKWKSGWRSLPFGRASRVEGYMSRVRVICRGSKKK